MARSWSLTGMTTVPILLIRVAVLLTTSSSVVGDTRETAGPRESHRASERLSRIEEAAGVVGALDAPQALQVVAVVGVGPVRELGVGEVGVDAARPPRMQGRRRPPDPLPCVVAGRRPSLGIDHDDVLDEEALVAVDERSRRGVDAVVGPAPREE